MADWSDGYWVSSDGLKLHYRDYAGGASRPPILCIPGLTRNARDFDVLAEALSSTHRVLAIDLPGHGHSAHRPDHAYWPREADVTVHPTGKEYATVKNVSGKAVDLAPAADKKDVKSQLDQYKSQAAAQQIQQAQPTPTPTIG